MIPSHCVFISCVEVGMMIKAGEDLPLNVVSLSEVKCIIVSESKQVSLSQWAGTHCGIL